MEEEIVISTWQRPDFPKDADDTFSRTMKRSSSKENIDMNAWMSQNTKSGEVESEEDHEEMTLDDESLSRLIEGDLKRDDENDSLNRSRKPKPKPRHETRFANAENQRADDKESKLFSDRKDKADKLFSGAKDKAGNLFAGEKDRADKLFSGGKTKEKSDDIITSPRPVPLPRSKQKEDDHERENQRFNFQNKTTDSNKISADKLFDSMGKSSKSVSFGDFKERKNSSKDMKIDEKASSNDKDSKNDRTAPKKAPRSPRNKPSNKGEKTSEERDLELRKTSESKKRPQPQPRHHDRKLFENDSYGHKSGNHLEQDGNEFFERGNELFERSNDMFTQHLGNFNKEVISRGENASGGNRDVDTIFGSRAKDGRAFQRQDDGSPKQERRTPRRDESSPRQGRKTVRQDDRSSRQERMSLGRDEGSPGQERRNLGRGDGSPRQQRKGLERGDGSPRQERRGLGRGDGSPRQERRTLGRDDSSLGQNRRTPRRDEHGSPGQERHLKRESREYENGFNRQGERYSRGNHGHEKDRGRNGTDMFEDHVPASDDIVIGDSDEDRAKEHGWRPHGNENKSRTPLKAHRGLEEMAKSPDVYNFKYESRDSPLNDSFARSKGRSSSMTDLNGWKNGEFEGYREEESLESSRSGFNSSRGIRDAVYADWLQRKRGKLKEDVRKKVEEKRKEEEKLKEKQEKEIMAKKAFEAWSSKKEEVIKSEVKKKKEIRDKDLEEKREKIVKKQDAKKYFESWKSKKDEVLKESYKDKRSKEQEEKQKKIDDHKEKIDIAKKAYDKWKSRKDEQLKEEARSSRQADKLKTKYEKEAEFDKLKEREKTFQEFLRKKGTGGRPPPSPTLTQRAWCPGGLTRGSNLIPEKVQPVIAPPKLNRSRSFSGVTRAMTSFNASKRSSRGW